MKIDLPHKLADFMDCQFDAPDILIVESDYYIKNVMEKFPNCKLYFASSDAYKLKDVQKEYGGCIYYIATDYKTRRLPLVKQSLDIVTGDLLFNECFNPQDIASGLGSYIKDTGYLLTSFDNLLYKDHIERLINDERSDFIVIRGYTREDFLRLMVASFYKEVFFTPLTEEDEPTHYAAKCFRSVYGTRMLKSYYSQEERKTLSTLLHRIEYGVEREKNAARLWEFVEEHGIFDDYLHDFIYEACYYRERVEEILQNKKTGTI